MAATVFVPAWDLIESKVFDALALVARDIPADPRLVIVGIDEPSFAEQEQQWPWPREIHAALVERLAGVGASVIAFDVVFADPGTPAGDRRLAEAIGRAGNVVLAVDETVLETPQASQRIRVEPLPDLLAAGATPGLITVPLDADQMIRRLSAAPDAFWRAVLRVDARRRAVEPPVVPGPPGHARYVRAVPSFAYASYYQALDPGRYLPPGFFTDRIVLVGLNLRAPPEPSRRHADLFATPLFLRTGRLLPGVEVQANAVNTALRGRVVARAPAALMVSLAAGLAALTMWTLRAWRPLASAVRAGAVAAGTLALAWLALDRFDLWLPVAAPAAGPLLAWVGAGAVAFGHERRARRQLRRAFERYVSPALVEQIVADPRRLRLGGERREVTVLFCDLAGFTTIAERLRPEEVVALLTRYLTTITRIVIDARGTVVKFLGDGLMALWGAPVEDPRHAHHAARAARAMQDAVAALRAQLVAAGRPAIHMRIGVHTGDAVVGNMGSETRFDYTATGDTVNLAARLEGANKVYGTDILLSDATVHAAGDAARFRLVDRVRVKGRTVPTDVFTIAEDPVLVALTSEAVGAYRTRAWDRAEAAWREIAARAPGDPVAPVYLERIAAWRATPPPADWDGAHTLDTK